MKFNNPECFWLLLLLIPMIVWYVWKQCRSDASIQISSVNQFLNIKKSPKVYLVHSLFLLRLLAIVFIIIALARPQLSDSLRSETTEGIDIMLSLDVSGTMLAEDLRPNRIEAAKNVAIEFISGRSNDNIGLVVFAGESFTQSPLTNDHAALMNLIKSVEYGTIEDGTAIGLGLANSVNRLKDSEAKSKVIILLTDGSNNAGDVAPITAAEIAKNFGIRVYTIGVGTRGMARYPFNTPMGIRYQDIPVEIDEGVLQQIADLTGGSYFRATDNSTLKSIYEQIDQLEKTKLKVRQYSKKSEEFMPFLLAALFSLCLEMLLRYTVFRRLP